MAAHPRGFWVILAGETPTAFRGRDRDALLPTLHQLQRTQPNVTLKWFEQNRLWTDPEEAKAARVAREEARRGRTREWRPGGSHVDPRARPQLSRDQKRARFKQRQRWPPKDDAGPPRPPTPGAPRPPDRRPKSGGRPSGRGVGRNPGGYRGPGGQRGPGSNRGPGGPRGRSGPPRGSHGPRGPRGPRGPKGQR